jgi:parallel beta-helix repeat protein
MPVVDARGSGSAITLAADGIVLEGFTETGGGMFEAGIHVFSSNNTLSGNDASSNTGAHGILLSSSNNNVLTGNNASNNHASNNYATGIFLEYSSNNTLSGNNASNNGNGIYLYYSKNNMLNGNNVTSNNGPGFYLRYSSNNTLSGNNATNNLDGIELEESGSNLIYNNLFNNTYNVQFGGSTINTWNITRQSGTNIIAGSWLGGNFWVNPGGTGFSQTCSDSNKDGICDIQYTLDSFNIDYLALANDLTVVNIISPNGGESWERNTTQVIRWNYSGSPGTYVKIEILKSGVPSIINSSAPNYGSYNWTIPTTQTPGTDYKVRITSTSNPAYNDTSNNNFTISSPTPSINVVSPNGGENWARRTTQTIRWNYTGSPGSSVKIEILKGGVASIIKSSTPNDGSYKWSIPSTQKLGTDYKVRITSRSNPAYNDTSNNNFTISIA